MKTDRTATLTFSDGSPAITFPIVEGTIGPEVMDIRALYGKTGRFTYDPGFMSTAACSSEITYIDGDKGELLYRGYPIEELAHHCDFLETCYLLLNGELPDPAQQKAFVGLVTNHTMVHEQMQFFFRGFRRDSHPMAVLVGVVGALSSFYHDSLDISDAQHRDVSAEPPLPRAHGEEQYEEPGAEIEIEVIPLRAGAGGGGPAFDLDAGRDR